MIRNIALVTLAIVTSCACAVTNAQAPDCPPAGDLVLTVGQYQLNLNEKKPVCVTVPGEFKIRVHNPPGSGVSIGAGDITVEAKYEGGPSITGSNDAPVNKITVKIGGSADPGDEFDFLIRVDGVGWLDPKVRVVGNTVSMALKSAAVYDLLDTLDLTLEEVNKLIPPRSEAK